MWPPPIMPVVYSDLNYDYLDVSNREILDAFKHFYKESLSQSMGTHIINNHPSCFLDTKASNRPDIFPKEYINALAKNFSEYLNPDSGLEDIPRPNQITPVIIQSNKSSDKINIWAAPIQAFEGRVVNVLDKLAMDVILVDKTGCMPDHEARIELEWVSEQDKDLVKRGAIFYLTLYK